VRETRGSGRSGVLRRCGITMAELLTGGGRGLNSGAGVVRIGATELGEVPGHGARLLRSSGKPGCGGAARLQRRRGDLRGGAARARRT